MIFKIATHQAVYSEHFKMRLLKTYSIHVFWILHMYISTCWRLNAALHTNSFNSRALANSNRTKLK